VASVDVHWLLLMYTGFFDLSGLLESRLAILCYNYVKGHDHAVYTQKPSKTFNARAIIINFVTEWICVPHTSNSVSTLTIRKRSVVITD